MSVAIKFCGMTREADIEIACGLGVDHLGLVLADSPRRLGIERAVELATFIRRLRPSTRIVVLLRDQPAVVVARAIATVAPDLLQFHGSESDAFCRDFGLPHWKALGMAGVVDAQAMAAAHPSASALLLDGHAPGAAGGSGTRFDWRQWPRLDRPLILAGGLTPDNVAEAIAATRPFAVDVSSGIESGAGIKDAARMRDFVAAARSRA